MINQLENILQAKLEEVLKPIEKRLNDLEERLYFESKKYQTSFLNLNEQLQEYYSNFSDLQNDFKDLQFRIKEIQILATEVLVNTEETIKMKGTNQLSENILSENLANNIMKEIQSQLANVDQSIDLNLDTVQVQEVTVYKTKSGQKYHRLGCGCLKLSWIPLTLQQARKQGLSECLKCRN